MNFRTVNRVDVVFTSAPLRPEVAESDPTSAGNVSPKAIINDSRFWCQLPKERATFQML